MLSGNDAEKADGHTDGRTANDKRANQPTGEEFGRKAMNSLNSDLDLNSDLNSDLAMDLDGGVSHVNKHSKDEEEFHEIFHSIPHPSFAETVKSHSDFIVKPVLSTLFTSTASSSASTKQTPAVWTPKYRFAVSAVRAVMTSIGAVSEPNPKYFQTITETPQPLPLKARLSPPDNFGLDETVVQFMRDKVRGPWPSVADHDPSYMGYGEWVDANKGKVTQSRVVYQLHGGAYILGSAQLYRRMAYFLSKAANARCYSINYRLAPLYPYPCAVIDAVSGYLHLLKSFKPEQIIIAGDSAGGGLTLATLLVLRDMNLPMPAGAYLMSPWVDLTLSFPSFHEMDGIDILPCIPTDERMPNRLHYYAHDLDLKEGYVSPLHASSLDHLPPLFIQSGTHEKLSDEIAHFSTKSLPASTSLVWEQYNGHIHVFQQLRSISIGAKVAVQRAGRWMQDIFELEFSTLSSHGKRPQKRHDAFFMDFYGHQVRAERL